MSVVWRGHIDGVAVGQQLVKCPGRHRYPVRRAELPAFLLIGIVGRADRVAADELRLRHESSGYAAGPDYSDPHRDLLLP